MINRLISITTAAAVTSLAVVACGGDEGSGSARAAERSFQKAALEHAECMRRRGVDVPDPKPGEGFLLDGGDVSPERLEEAQRACDEEVGAPPAPELSAEDQRKFRERALRHARCMRRNGVDFPDPTFGPNGQVRIELGEAPPLDDPAFRETDERCRGLLGAPRVAPGGGR